VEKSPQDAEITSDSASIFSKLARPQNSRYHPVWVSFSEGYGMGLSTRRNFLKTIGCGALGLSLGTCRSARGKKRRPNILLITADDMNYNSPGCYGSSIPGITPNIDRLAKEGMRFLHAHVNIAVCQPCRQSLMTGRYAFRHGGEGFNPIWPDVPTLGERLRAAGYWNGILGKEKHLKPDFKFCMDYVRGEKELASGMGIGRNPSLYKAFAREFFDQARARGKPFFLMANPHDPHRPFAGSENEKKSWGEDLPEARRWVTEEEVTVPGFLPDIPDVRKEIAQYYTSVFRCDEAVGAVLEAVDEAGFRQNTVVMFLSDNGMSFPFAKSNCYLNSTKTPWIVRWPGNIRAGSVNRTEFISGIDFMPTVLEIVGLPQIEGMDGKSFLPLLQGKSQPERESVFTEFHQTFAKNRYPMRCVQTAQFGYIFNFCPDGQTKMTMDSTSGLSFKAMQEAALKDREIESRVRLFSYRMPEEFYHLGRDPDARENLIQDSRFSGEIEVFRKKLEAYMAEAGDPALEAFRQRKNPDEIARFMKEQRKKSGKR
jgi:N-sulfoglucosamine sulfohydrolase